MIQSKDERLGLRHMQRQRQRQNPPRRGKSNGNNVLAALAPSCRQKTLDRAVVVIDGMTIHEKCCSRVAPELTFTAIRTTPQPWPQSETSAHSRTPSRKS